jgi:hypothetical protein
MPNPDRKKGALMPGAATNEATRREWRELGFFYDQKDDARKWLLIGSPEGPLGFARILRSYASHLSNDKAGEHVHLGPCAYLKIGTSLEPQITSDWISGPIKDLRTVAATIERTEPICTGVSL